MCTRISILRLLSLLAIALPFESQSAVTVYCCDATAEAQYIQDLASLPSITVDLTSESFEGDAWVGTRSLPEATVTSQGITWAPSSSGVAGMSTSIGGGDVHDGSYLMFPVDDRNNHLIPDQYNLTANGITLYGVGGWFRSASSTKLAFTSNGSEAIDFTGEQSTVFDWTFLGFIDDAGFSNLMIQTSDEIGNEVNTFFSDDFTLGAQSGAFPGQKLQFSSATYSTNESTSSTQITVQRSGGTSGALSIDYASTTDGTASAGQDFTAVSGTLDFADGESSKQFTINLLDDGVFEGDETVTLTLSGSAVGVLNTATLTILENDAQPVGSVEFSGSSYRVDEGIGSILVTVQRSNGSVGSGSVDYAVSDGTATAGSDYTSAAGSLSFIDGETSKSFSVDITDDSTQEGAESVVLSLSNPVSVSLGGRDFADITILDNEPIPAAGSIQFSGSAYSVTEGLSEVVIPVTRVGGSSGAVSVVCSTADSSALAGSDYSATQSSISFTEGETLQHCRIPLLNDSSYENDELFMASLGALTGGAILATPAMAVVTIQNDDPVPVAGSLQFSLVEFQQTENGGSATISVTRSGGSSGAVSVNYATSDNSAAAGEDYNATNGSLSFADGVTTASFQVTVLDDSAYEGDERVNLSLSNPSGGAVIGANSAADLIITEDDQTPASGQIEFSVNTYAADEFNGSVTIEVVRQNGSTGVAMVNYTTSDGTATAGNDYIVNSATLIFANGEISKSFDVTLNDDADFEGIETFNLTLSNVFGALLGDITSASVSLSDDDDPPAAGAVVFTDSIQSVSEDGNSATISVSREGGSAGAISVDYTTMDGSAIASSDYTFSTGRISFAAGEAVSKSFDVAIINDTQLEGDEQLALQLVNPQGGAVLGTQSLSQLTITDDEAQSSSAILAFTVNSLSVDESSAVANISISRANVLTGSVTVDLSVESTTAVSGTDFNVTTGTLQFVDGESQKNISVEIIDNTLEDGNKTITFTIGNATGVAVIDTANSTVTLTILDDDGTTNPGNGDSGGGGGGGGSIDLLLLAFLLSLTLFLYKFRLNLSPKC